MTEQERKDMYLLDELAEKAGGFVAPLSKRDTKYGYRKLSQYCKEKNIDPQDLTLRELKNFIIQ